MTHPFDELSKSLADESLPRRESLRRLGLLLTGAVLGPLASGLSAKDGPYPYFRFRAAPRAPRPVDPCVSFCSRCTTSKRSQCLSACRACNGQTSRLSGRCGSYTCVDTLRDPNCGSIGNNCSASGLACCGGSCIDVTGDINNCGGCGVVCGGATPFCTAGACTECFSGLTKCGTTCVLLSQDANNCGACGNVCGGATPYCNQGTCSMCGSSAVICNGVCTNIFVDKYNCGGCGIECPDFLTCLGGVCVFDF